jgi:hypothetical protein
MKGVLRSSNSGMKWVSTGSGFTKRCNGHYAIAVTRAIQLLPEHGKRASIDPLTEGHNGRKRLRSCPTPCFINSIVTDSNGNCFTSSGNGVVLLSRDDGVSWTGVGTGFPLIVSILWRLVEITFLREQETTVSGEDLCQK